MADEKKPGAPAPAPATDPFVEVVWTIISILLVIYLLNSIFVSISNSKYLSSGLSGFTYKNILLSHTKPISSLDNPIGAKVVSLSDTSVYGTPGGNQIGKQKIGSRGKILQGPVSIDGERYWYVDYDNGVDGWVKESDLGYVESELNPFEKFLAFIFSSIFYIKFIIYIICICLVLGIVWLFRKITALRLAENDRYYPKIEEAEENVNHEWQNIINHVESDNESDWRLAILEADIILANLLEKMSLPGETIGDKLKVIDKADFRTIDNAWEAHKIRNRIAHDGSSFMINKREARRVIDLYETVFQEFKLI